MKNKRISLLLSIGVSTLPITYALAATSNAIRTPATASNSATLNTTAAIIAPAQVTNVSTASTTVKPAVIHTVTDVASAATGIKTQTTTDAVSSSVQSTPPVTNEVNANQPKPTESQVQVKPFGSAPQYSPPMFSAQAGQDDADELAYEPNQVLIVWESDAQTTNGLATLQAIYHLRPRQRYQLSHINFTLVRVDLPNPRAADELRIRLRKEQPSWIVDFNARSLLFQSDNLSQRMLQHQTVRLYAQQMLGMNKSRIGTSTPMNALSILQKTSRLKVGVIDTGFNPLFAQSSALNGSVIIQKTMQLPTDKLAPTTHGSEILQLMVGAPQANGFVGVAPPIDISWANVMRDLKGKAVTNTLVLSVALDWMVGQRVALVNMSLGGRGDAILNAVVARVLSKNIAIVAAIGNNPSPKAPPMYPAAYAGVWGVTAVDAVGKLYSNASVVVPARLAAPGVDVWVPDAEVSGGQYVSGTSYATALVSGVLAWQPDSFWSLTANQKLERICLSARPLARQQGMGCGLIQR